MTGDAKSGTNKIQLRKRAYRLVAERLSIAVLNGDFDLTGLTPGESEYVLNVIENEVAPHFKRFETDD